MKKFLLLAAAVIIPPMIVAWWIVQAIKEFEHVADLGDMAWFDDVFADYEWDDWYDPA